MKVRYMLKYNQTTMTAIYRIEELEKFACCFNDDLKIVRRDYSTGMFDIFNEEVYSNDFVEVEGGDRGYVVKKPGGFYLNGKPLGNFKIKEVIK